MMTARTYNVCTEKTIKLQILIDKFYFVESLTGKSFNGPRCQKTKYENSNKDINLVHLWKVDWAHLNIYVETWSKINTKETSNELWVNLANKG